MNKKRFIKRIIGDGKLNLRKSYEDNGSRRVILSYNKKSYERIKEFLPELNKISRNLYLPFKVSVDEENLSYGEVRFTYIDENNPENFTKEGW